MDQLTDAKLFLDFYTAPDSTAKSAIWEDEICGELGDERALEVLSFILAGTVAFTDYNRQMLSIVARPPRFANNDVELAMKLTEAVAAHADDTEAAHTTADEFLVSILEGLGHPAVAEAYRAVPKWAA